MGIIEVKMEMIFETHTEEIFSNLSIGLFDSKNGN